MQFKKHWIAGILFLPSVAGCAGRAVPADSDKSDAGGDNPAAIVVRAQPVSVRTMAETVNGLGRCRPLNDHVASLTSAVEGQVQQLLVKPGDTVVKNQPIVQLDPIQANANLAEKTAACDALKASLRLLQAPPRPEELKSQELAVDQAKLSCDKAKAAVERLKPLATKGEVSSPQLFEAQLAASQAELQCQTAWAQLEALKLGPRPQAVAEAQAHVKSAEAAVDSAANQVHLHTLCSPIDGVLDRLSCQLGQTIAPGADVGEIVDARQLLVHIWIPARVAVRVKLGQAATVSAANSSRPTALAGRETTSEESHSTPAQPVVGQVTFIGRIVDSQTGNLPVQIAIDNSNGRFAVGQAVSASIRVNEKEDVLAVPQAALFDLGTKDVGEEFILSVIRDGKSARLKPKLGIRQNGWVELLQDDSKEPLKAGEMVIVEGGYNLPENTAVTADADRAGDKLKDTKASQEAKDSGESEASPTADKDTSSVAR